MTAGEVAQLLREDNREKRRARGGQAVAKKRPRVLITPAMLERTLIWWRVAPALVHIRISDGAVLAWRWPLAECWTMLQCPAQGKPG